jgi:hypothetical protein
MSTVPAPALVRLGMLEVSRFIIGGNPFSAFSHQGAERDRQMRHFYSTARIKAALHHAESLGIRTHLGRADHHVTRLLLEYWDEGGKLDWIAQTCPEVGSQERCIQNAVAGGAKACFLHGGWMDAQFAAGRLQEVPDLIRRIRDAGMSAGIAGHEPRVHEWAAQNLDLDFHMCAYYNPIPRNERGEHVQGAVDLYREVDRDRMMQTLGGLGKPVIHYKILAAGRTSAPQAFDFAARHMRAGDAVCVGIFEGDKPDMLEEDLRLLAEGLAKHKGAR